MRLSKFTVNSSLFTVHCLLFTVCCLLFIVSGCEGKVKEPSVAGAFYPADAKTLKEMVDGFLSAAEYKPVDGRLIALISPHAGYEFSGHVAAYSYRHLKERDVDTVILIGPSHYSTFTGASVYTKGSMKTPLGKIAINKKIAKSLINEKANVAFYPAAFEKEHSLEVQMPFLQQSLKNFSIVPILIGSPTRESFQFLTEKLTEILRKNEKAIIIASTDLSHYHDYETAVNMDSKTIDAISRLSTEEVERLMASGQGEMCGGFPVMFTMAVARALGATNGVVYKYANSGDVTNDKNRVVGYSAMGLYMSTLTEAQKKEILSLAKNTILHYVKHNEVLQAETKDPRLMANGATFVTINRQGNLRGCIGNIQPFMPLYQSVIRNAVSAASKDYRFSPVRAEELNDMEVEVTVLSPLVALQNIKDIKIGVHGLFIVSGENSGILLPQVATEYKWDVNAFLENVSLKAGLPKDAWKNSQLYTFTADIIK
ncbi:MAG: AmmeMemoRadiSam system protein B [Nitrospirae bacterium]|nr:AmmeMemoRadiSam system protein B [Nitrospirota bacterium]